MRDYILIEREDHSGDCDAHPVDTREDRAEARRALRAAGYESAVVWRGEGDDAIRTGTVVWS
jgi:hypothetical protein